MAFCAFIPVQIIAQINNLRVVRIDVVATKVNILRRSACRVILSEMSDLLPDVKNRHGASKLSNINHDPAFAVDT